MVLTIAGCRSVPEQKVGELELAYQLRLVPEDQVVYVTLDFPGLGNRSFLHKLKLLSGTTFVGLEQPLIEDVRLNNPARGERLEESEPGVWTWNRPGSSQSTLHYAVPLRHRERPEVLATHSATAWPYSEDTHAFLTGSSIFLAPTLAPSTDASWSVRLQTPEGWKQWTTWEQDPEGTFWPADRLDMQSNVLCAGAYTEFPLEAGGFEGTLLIWPGQTRALEPLARQFLGVLDKALEVFDGPPEGPHLFVFTRPDLKGFSGTLIGRSIPLGVEAGLESVAQSQALGLLAHEFFHTWGANRAPLANDMRWLNEGGTEYMARWTVAQTRSGSDMGFANFLQEMFSEAKWNAYGATNSLMEAGGPVFFEGGDAYRWTYDGGALICAWLDLALRKSRQGRSLVGFLREFPARGAGLGDVGSDGSTQASAMESVALEDCIVALSSYGGIYVAQGLRKWVSAPFPVDSLIRDFSRMGVSFHETEQPVSFDLRSNLNGNLLLDLDPKSLGGRAGLRAGDRVLSVNGIEVVLEDQVRKAWRQPRDGYLRVRIERDGQIQELEQRLLPEILHRPDPSHWLEDPL